MSSTIENAVSHLADAPEVLASKHALVGLDGFVDSIIRVVQKKTKSGDRTHYPSISSLAERIAAAAGKSTALELTIQTVKLGGNGPIMANALCSFDLPLTYIGAVGDVDGDGVHPVFQPMANACEVIVVAETAYTDALEFNDGKLMLQKMECLDNLSYDSIIACTGEEGLFNLFEKADAVALNHWSSIPHMTELWQRIQSDICPKLSERPRHIFFDLADPQKRDSEDIADALQTLAKFQSWYDTSLGLNEKEGEHICGVLGLNPSGDTKEELMMARATAIRNALGIHSVVVWALPQLPPYSRFPLSAEVSEPDS